MSIRVAITSEIKVGVERGFLVFLEENLPNVRGFKGCLQVSVLLSPDRRNMFFDELWLSREHHEKYLAFIENNGVLAALADYLESPPSIHYYDQIAV